MSQTYSISVLNNSGQNASFCLYQESNNPQDKSVAWLTQRAMPNQTIQFHWNLEYSFVQGETGYLVPGVVFRSDQSVPTGLDKDNMITLTDEFGRSTFKDQRNGITNMLTIQCDATIQPNRVAAGIGIAGAPILVTQAIANLDLNFTPQSKYRLTFGNFNQGDVLDAGQIFDYAMIDFQSGIVNYKVTYNPDRTWTVQPGY